jgi:hypothetical protein
MPMWRAVNLSGTKDRGSGKLASIATPLSKLLYFS